MSVASPISFEVTGGFTNTGLALAGDVLAIGNFTAGKIVFMSPLGDAVAGDITLAGAPAGSVQGVAHLPDTDEFWVAHYALNPTGSLRRYSRAGALQQTIETGISGANGPNGIFFDAATNRVFAAFTDNIIRGFNATTGAVEESITIGSSLATGATVDGICPDPTDSNAIWVSMDTTLKIGKINRTTGAAITSFDCPASPEDMCFVDGYLYICCDDLYHGGTPNGNRVWRYDVTAQKPVAVWREAVAPGWYA